MRASEHSLTWEELEQLLTALEIANNKDDFVQIREVLKHAVLGFTPQCCVKDLLSEQKLSLPI